MLNLFVFTIFTFSDGAHFITATTAPRMQVDNSFRIWDFTGKNVFEWKAVKQLFGVTSFLPSEPLPFPEDKLDEYVQKLGNKLTNISESCWKLL